MKQKRPNFIYVGAPKAGSTWLFHALSEHSDVFVAPEKSTTYFETTTPGPIEDYLALFAQAAEASAVGEIAHDTFLDPGAAARIHAAFPDMKILCCLREPGDFAKSAMQWWQTHTKRYGETPAEMLRHERLVRLLDYPARVQPFYDVFPSEQVKIVFFDDLRAAPDSFLREIFEFLGVDTAFRPSVLDRVVNPASRARFKGLTHLAYATGGILRSVGFGRFVEYIKQRPLIERMLYAPLKSPVTSETEEILATIRKEAQPGFDQLEKVIGHPVPAAWRQS